MYFFLPYPSKPNSVSYFAVRCQPTLPPITINTTISIAIEFVDSNSPANHSIIPPTLTTAPHSVTMARKFFVGGNFKMCACPPPRAAPCPCPSTSLPRGSP